MEVKVSDIRLKTIGAWDQLAVLVGDTEFNAIQLRVGHHRGVHLRVVLVVQIDEIVVDYYFTITLRV